MVHTRVLLVEKHSYGLPCSSMQFRTEIVPLSKSSFLPNWFSTAFIFESICEKLVGRISNQSFSRLAFNIAGNVQVTGTIESKFL